MKAPLYMDSIIIDLLESVKEVKTKCPLALIHQIPDPFDQVTGADATGQPPFRAVKRQQVYVSRSWVMTAGHREHTYRHSNRRS